MGRERDRIAGGFAGGALVLAIALGCTPAPPSPAILAQPAESVATAPPRTLSPSRPPPSAPAPAGTGPAEQPDTARVRTIYGGPRHQCVVLEDGHAECWGRGEEGALGDGHNTDRSVPTTVPGIANAIEIALGETSTCALLRDGTVACWGNNASGQLGDGTKRPHPTPAPVPGLSSVVQISSGAAHVCARLANGTAHCWGANESGQLGDGTKIDRSSPTIVHGLKGVAQLAVGGQHSCARRSTGTVTCWGSNGMAQLGVPGRSFRRSSSRPIFVPTLTGVVDLVAGSNHNCVRLASGSVACWGWDEECQLGFVSSERCVANTPCKASPTPLPGLTDVVQIAPSAMHTCVLRKTGTIECWGDDPRAFLPNNTVNSNVPRLCQPTPVTSIRGATQISVYWGGVCAVLADDAIWCWGSNWFGELGDGTTTAHSDPAIVKR